MAVIQNIPNTRLTATQVFTLQASAQPWTEASVSIDRTINGGLNATAGTTINIGIDYSTDGGVSWLNVGGVTLPGGAANPVQTTDFLGIGIGQPFPTGTGFRLTTQVTGPAVRAAGTATYG